MNIAQLIQEQFRQSQIHLNTVEVVHPFDERNFGNWCAVAVCSLGKFQITNDRGQIFLEVFDESLQNFVWCQKIYPSLNTIYKNWPNWHLTDLLNAIKTSNKDGLQI